MRGSSVRVPTTRFCIYNLVSKKDERREEANQTGVSQWGPNARDRRDDTPNFYSNSKRDSLNVNCGRYSILPRIFVFPRFDIEFTPCSTFLFSLLVIVPSTSPPSPPSPLSPLPSLPSQVSYVVVCISIFLSKVLVNRCHFLNEYMLKSQLRISRDIHIIHITYIIYKYIYYIYLNRPSCDGRWKIRVNIFSIFLNTRDSTLWFIFYFFNFRRARRCLRSPCAASFRVSLLQFLLCFPYTPRDLRSGLFTHIHALTHAWYTNEESHSTHALTPHALNAR